MRVKIISRKAKPFTAKNGDEMDYYWYDAVRAGDGVTIQFGSSRDYDLGHDDDLNIIKVENRLGRIMYKEAI